MDQLLIQSPKATRVAFVLDGNAAVIPPAADISEVNNLENGNFHNVILLWDPDSQELSYELTHSDGTVYTNNCQEYRFNRSFIF